MTTRTQLLNAGLEAFILHMPHTGTEIPDRTGYVAPDEVLLREMNRVTDWGVPEIFDFKGVTAIRPEFSRLFCDVERFYDAEEPLSEIGFGITYTRTESGAVLRELTDGEREHIVNTYYEPHHEKLSKCTQKKIDEHGKAFILDCHSFPDEPLGWERPSGLRRPDICIGTDDIHTPEAAKDFATDYFSQLGYELAVNHPFAGTLIPASHYGNKQTFGMMIEVNRKLYQNAATQELDKEATTRLNKQIQNCIKELAR